MAAVLIWRRELGEGDVGRRRGARPRGAAEAAGETRGTEMVGDKDGEEAKETAHDEEGDGHAGRDGAEVDAAGADERLERSHLWRSGWRSRLKGRGGGGMRRFFRAKYGRESKSKQRRRWGLSVSRGKA